MKKIVWLIDDNENEIHTYTRELRRLMPDSVQVEPIFPPYHGKEEYISVLNNPDTVCLIIDQRLRGTGKATYTGIELAQYLRGTNKKIPLYILTNFAQADDEFVGGEWSVEDIIPKNMLNNEEQSRIIQARIRRHLDVYEDILNKRVARFNDLLKKSLNDNLDETEQQELLELQFERAAAIVASEQAEQQGLDELIRTNKKLIESLNRFSQEQDSDVTR